MTLFTTGLEQTTYTICTASVCLLWYIFHWQHRAHTLVVGHTQQYIQGHKGLQFTHSSHAFEGRHAVDSPSTAGVINDFLWLLSNSPSQSTHFLQLTQTLVQSLKLLLGKTAGWRQISSSEEQEVLAGRSRRAVITVQQASTQFGCYTLVNMLSNVSWVRVRFPVDGQEVRPSTINIEKDK